MPMKSTFSAFALLAALFVMAISLASCTPTPPDGGGDAVDNYIVEFYSGDTVHLVWFTSELVRYGGTSAEFIDNDNGNRVTISGAYTVTKLYDTGGGGNRDNTPIADNNNKADSPQLMGGSRLDSANFATNADAPVSSDVVTPVF